VGERLELAPVRRLRMVPWLSLATVGSISDPTYTVFLIATVDVAVDVCVGVDDGSRGSLSVGSTFDDVPDTVPLVYT